MLIDWFTVGAQALNFVILVWLLKRFLYKPILDAIDARETRIASELANADASQREAKKERDEFFHKNADFDQQRTALLSEAARDAKTERQRLMEEVRATTDALRTKQQETLRNDARNLNELIRQRIQHEVFAMTRKALTDLAGTTLEERMTDIFIRRLRALDDAAKASLAAAAKGSSSAAQVRSAFVLEVDQQAAIEHAFNDTFATDIRMQFAIAPSLVSGLELTVGGQKVSWSIAQYLSTLEKGMADLLKEKDRPVTADDAVLEKAGP